jgi:hypothetical protein
VLVRHICPKLWCVGYTRYTQKNGAVSKLNKKLIAHITPAQRTPSAAATVQVECHTTHIHTVIKWDEFNYRVDVCRVTQRAHIEGL